MAFSLHFFSRPYPNPAREEHQRGREAGAEGKKSPPVVVGRRGDRAPRSSAVRCALPHPGGGRRGVSELLCRRSSSSDPLIQNFITLWNILVTPHMSYQIDFGEYQTRYPAVPKQNNSDDYGVFMMKFMEIHDPRAQM
ncbi:hypothetical protein ACQ4PT_033236 [Festuca glaucescens]